MELFGVQEVSTSKAGSAPGYTYVAEPVGSGGPPASRKRAARTLGAAVAVDYSAKQEAKVLRDLAALDKESHRDVHIPVPIRHRDAAGRGETDMVLP
jgi:zinc finger HIT domain-containing protein 1